MERRLGIRCAGVVPFLKNLGLEEEDSVAMEDRRTVKRGWADTSSLRVGVIALPHMANFTDFDALAAEPSVALAFLEDPADVAMAHVLILPGSKQTLDDLQWLRDGGFEPALAAYKGPMMGICGGFQMLGLSIEDPAGVESSGVPRTMQGLGYLPVRTLMRGEKTVRRVAGRTDLWGGCSFSGYEIHMGETTPHGDAIVSSGRISGTYIHGLFDDDELRHSFVNFVRESCGLAPALSHVCVTARRQARIDRWAAHVLQSLDMDLIRGWALNG